MIHEYNSMNLPTQAMYAGFSTHIVRRFDHIQRSGYIWEQPCILYRTHLYAFIKTNHSTCAQTSNIGVQRTEYALFKSYVFCGAQ